MKEIEIDSIKQFERRLIIRYSTKEGYEKRNHLGQVMEVTAEAGGGQLTIDLKDERIAEVMKDILEKRIQKILGGYF